MLFSKHILIKSVKCYAMHDAMLCVSDPNCISFQDKLISFHFFHVIKRRISFIVLTPSAFHDFFHFVLKTMNFMENESVFHDVDSILGSGPDTKLLFLVLMPCSPKQA
jgi:hypothetical protein